MTTASLTAVFPAVLDALSRAGVAITVYMQRRSGEIEKRYANEPSLRLLGYSLEEWLAEPNFELVAPEQRERLRTLYEKFSIDQALPPVIEVTMLHRDGHRFTMEQALGRFMVEDGAIVVLVARDPGAQLAPLSLLEADRVALVSALAAGFAHETNNPLTSVLLNLRSLRKQIIANVAPAAQATALRCLEDITIGAERIASNVRALQTLATRTATQELDLSAVVSAALRLAGPTVEPRAHVVRRIFPVRAVVGEESRIGQAVLAMLLFSCSGFSNELSDSPRPNVGPSAQIVVSVEERDRGVVVEVSDNGRDLTPEEVDHAFDPFFRSAVRGAGVGVGLGVARSVAATLGGRVTLARNDQGGAVITMWLPVATTPDPA